MTGKRVLLVGTSFSAAPLLHALQRMGCHVSVCGSQPDDPCVAYADAYYRLDYSDREALLDLARSQSFDHICPTCNDFSLMSAAYVAAELGLPGFDDPATTETIFNKSLFRAFTEKNGIPSPRARRITASSDAAAIDLSPPLLIKPVDSFSGRGVTRIDDTAAIPEAIRQGSAESRTGEVLVEQFVPGTLHSHSAFLSRGEIVEDHFVDEFCQVYPYQVDCSNSPSRLPERLRAAVRECMRELARLLKLGDGLLHTQFLVDGDDFRIVECMRRCPGDLYYHLIQYSTRSRYIDNYLAPYLGREILPSAPGIVGLWARHTVSLPRDDVFFSFEHRIPASRVSTFPLCQSADAVRKAPYGKVAILFARFDDEATLFATTPRLGSLITLNTLESLSAQQSN